MIWKIYWKTLPTPHKHRTKNNTEATNKKDTSDTRAESFSTNSSLKNNPQFLNFKNNTEKHSLNFKWDSSETYN